MATRYGEIGSGPFHRIPCRGARTGFPPSLAPTKISLGLFDHLTPPEQDVEFWLRSFSPYDANGIAHRG
jgi:hypothetical protein